MLASGDCIKMVLFLSEFADLLNQKGFIKFSASYTDEKGVFRAKDLWPN